MAKAKAKQGPHTGLAEGENVEFKTKWVEDAMKDVAAFANTSGGILYLGVDDSGHVMPDADVSDRHQRAVSSKIMHQFQIAPSIRVENQDGEQFLAVSIAPAGSRVVLLRGVAYRRSGSQTVEVPELELQSFILERTERSWDALPAAITIDDIDPDRVRAFIRSAHDQEQQRLPDGVREDDPVELNLDKLGLLKNGRPTNAAMLLFGQDPQKLCRHARTRVFYFRNINDFDEYPVCAGTLGDQINAVMRSIAVANPTRITFPGASEGEGGERLKRNESVAYPELALKEAITNALIHRDYTVPGSDVEVKIFPDRLVIQNPGTLMPGVTTEDLKRDPHPSRRRNPLLADVASKDHWIEQAGTGTTRMVDLCVQAGLPEPEFENRSSGFTVTFRRAISWSADALKLAGFNDRQVRGVQYVHAHGEMKLGTYRELVDTSERTGARDLKELVDRGVLVKHGSGAGAYYAIGAPPKLP